MILFGVLTLLSLAMWIAGALTAAIFPWFGGVRAETIGRIGMTIFICGEGFVYAFGWLHRLFSDEQKPAITGLHQPKRYGNIKHH